MWAISTSKPFKLSGTDGIVFALLQHGVTLLMTYLCHIFRACLATGYIGLPKAWMEAVKVAFNPKPRKPNNTEAKAYNTSSSQLLPVFAY